MELFMYDLSDRELERELRFNIAYKWFCGFTAFEQTPDHSYFGRFREREGTKRIGKVFKAIVNKAKEKQLIRGVFHFVDATSIVTKNTTWGERDKAIKEGEEALNNANVKKYSADPQARFGCYCPQRQTSCCPQFPASFSGRIARPWVFYA